MVFKRMPVASRGSVAYEFDGGIVAKNVRYQLKDSIVTVKGWLVLDNDGWAVCGEPFKRLSDAKDYARDHVDEFKN